MGSNGISLYSSHMVSLGYLQSFQHKFEFISDLNIQIKDFF